MVTQQFFLPMVPDSAPIVINIAQYDFDAAGYAGRLFFNLVNAGAAYDMDNATATFQGEKPDGTMFAYPANVINQSVVRVNVRQQMTAIAGRVVCQLIVSNADGQVGSFNIWLEVQPSSGSGSDPSQTDIPALIAQAKEYADAAEQAAEDAAAWSANPPYIGANGNWFVYDTATETYIDTGVYAAGIEGSLWYTGTAISGKSATPTVYPTGISVAREHDMYLNKTEGAIYQCTLGGDDTTAKWVYVMTLAGGGGGASDYPDLGMKPQINGHELQGGNQTAASLGLQNELTTGNGIDITSDTISAKLSAGSNVTITPQADGTLEISSTGGSGGSLDDLSDVNIDTGTLANDQILKYSNGEWVNGTGGGHEMIANNLYLTQLQAASLDDTNNKVASGYAIGNWSNASITTIIAHVAKDNDTIGTWVDTWETDGVRTGWIWHKDLYNVVGDNEVEISIDFDVSGKEVVGLYAYRIDDNVPQTIGGETVNGGAIAIKLTSPIQNAIGVNVAVNLKRQRTNKVNATYIS